MEIKKVLVIFKTHLDIGFTDFAENVKQKYFDVFIPGAVKTANALRNSDTDASFKWTTGSWLIHEYLRNNPGESGEEVRQAIIDRQTKIDNLYIKPDKTILEINKATIIHHMKLNPSPFEKILCTGQPILISMMSQPENSTALAAALASFSACLAAFFASRLS